MFYKSKDPTNSVKWDRYCAVTVDNSERDKIKLVLFADRN